jgi:hypothetical protein
LERLEKKIAARGKAAHGHRAHHAAVNHKAHAAASVAAASVGVGAMGVAAHRAANENQTPEAAPEALDRLEAKLRRRRFKAWDDVMRG